MKVLRFQEKNGIRHLALVIEKENLDRMMEGDPLDFDTDAFYHGQNIAVTIGYMESASNDPQEVMQHVMRNLHRTADDGQKPRLIKPEDHAAELASLTQQIEELKRERDVAIAKLELLNSFYASDADETENEKLSRATKSLMAAERQVSELKEALRRISDKAAEAARVLGEKRS